MKISKDPIKQPELFSSALEIKGQVTSGMGQTTGRDFRPGLQRGLLEITEDSAKSPCLLVSVTILVFNQHNGNIIPAL
ncbi:hypothetical protein RRG08_046441 [Elysia crispata]|uniref:Uncharacterized protein n=1 Tax=Elysia crispata TaxID=231223 RepID=A0AAE0YJC0_9GAST|nr:hypothetical protein RRG08_046441 [Elysia crispata]